jgi:hypothetical protein
LLRVQYRKFAVTEGLLSKKDMVSYIKACGAGEHATEQRMNQIFQQFGDSNGLMTERSFLDFYREACVSRVEAVWDDLTVHGYNHEVVNELALEEEERRLVEDDKVMPRFLLASNDEYFTLLFKALTCSDKVAEAVWALLQRLPTNPALKLRLVSLEQVSRPDANWSTLLDADNAFKLLYGLQIIESLTDVAQVGFACVGAMPRVRWRGWEERAAARRRAGCAGG